MMFSWHAAVTRSAAVWASVLALALCVSCDRPARKDPEGARAKGEHDTATNAPVAAPVEDCGLPASLRARGWPRRLEPTTKAEPTPRADGAVTLAVLPDTQYYASCRQPHLTRQVKWVTEQKGARSIAAAITLGDLTDHNDEPEWSFVKAALAPLGNSVPLVLTTGNHDHDARGRALERGSELARYFPTPGAATKAALTATLTPGDVENAYYRLELPGKKARLGILSLEWSPRTVAVDWARSVFGRYPEDRVIFVTHAYTYFDDTRYDFAKYGAEQEWNPRAYGTSRQHPERLLIGKSAVLSLDDFHPDGAYDGEMLWNELLSAHPGLFLVLSGHVLGDGTGLLTSRGKAGNGVHQVLANYQMLDEGGLGYLRLVELAPDGARLSMKTYSPSLDVWATAADQTFELPIEPPLE